MSQLPKVPTVAEVMAGIKKAQSNIFKPVTKVGIRVTFVSLCKFDNLNLICAFRRVCATTIFLCLGQSLMLSYHLLWVHLVRWGGYTQGFRILFGFLVFLYIFPSIGWSEDMNTVNTAAAASCLGLYLYNR